MPPNNSETYFLRRLQRYCKKEYLGRRWRKGLKVKTQKVSGSYSPSCFAVVLGQGDDGEELRTIFELIINLLHI